MRFLQVTGLVFLALLCSLGEATAELRLPKAFGNHMVLQRDKPVVVWGWAAPGAKIAVSIAEAKSEATANERGEWKVTLPAMKAGGPHTVIVKGSEEVRFEDVLVGEVWLCSGQSNMEMGIASCKDAQKEIADANYPKIRLLLVENKWSPQPEPDITGIWKVCSPKTVAEGGWGGFSAAGYYFGRELHRKLDVPVGLIDATWGGTRIESWTPPEGFGLVPALDKEHVLVQLADARTQRHRERMEKLLRDTEQWVGETRTALSRQTSAPPMPTFPPELLPPHDVQNATALYNGMIHPVRPFAIRGAIWYQGESNSGEGMLYAERMKALVGGWRNVWQDDNLAFYFVQIAPYNYGGNPEVIGEFWEAQAAAAAAIPNCGMAVINDIGDLKDIHPTNKQEVGHRLALLALHGAYGQPNVLCSGPTLKSMTTQAGNLRLTFGNCGTGLTTRDEKPPTWFEIIDADEGGFVPADAKIDGDSIILSSPEVKKPVAMRFAWSMLAEPNLANSYGLPASAFRAGTVPNRDLLQLKVREAKEYTLVYDLDLAKLSDSITYDRDERQRITKPFDRIAYFLELQDSSANTDYVFVSCDAFTTSLDQVGIPTFTSGSRFQQNLAHMNVVSNVRSLRTGSDLSGGNIEFWPHNYGTENGANVPNASGQAYDFGDQPGDPLHGYGSMQIHNHDARQTLFAINHWQAGDKADIGIGNQSTGQSDWTFAGNAGSYRAKRLRVFVRCK